ALPPYLESGVGRRAADEGPFLDAMPVPALEAAVLGFQGKAGFDDEMQGSLVLKADIDRVVLTHGEELHEVHGFPLDLFKAVEGTTMREPRSGGLAMFADDGLG